MTELNKDLNGVADPNANNNGVKNEVPAAPADDTQAKLSELTQTVTNLAEALTKSQQNEENYKKGLLSAKQKLKDNGFDDEPQEDKIVQAVNQALDAKLAPIIEKINRPEQNNLITEAQRKIDELKLALNNRSQISTAGNGTNQENQEVKHSYFTDAQLAELKAKGLDPKKVEENMRKYKGQI